MKDGRALRRATIVKYDFEGMSEGESFELSGEKDSSFSEGMSDEVLPEVRMETLHQPAASTYGLAEEEFA